MTLAARLILILALLTQAVAGVRVASCGPTPAPRAATPSACACCRPDAGEGSCPAGGSVCCCGQAQPEEPKAPPAGIKTGLEQVLSLLPTLTGVGMPEPRFVTELPTPAAGSARPPAQALRPLLCVWVV